MLRVLAASLAVIALGAGDDRIEIAPGVMMPRVNAGHPDEGGHDKGNETASALAWFAAGGRGLDTALDYHNQDQVAVAVAASGLKREEIFLTTKISGRCTARVAQKAIDEDLALLQTSFVDLLLHHFPCPSREGTIEVWLVLQAAYANGQARAIGVSNYAIDDLDAILGLPGVPPAVNQCQMSIGSHDDRTIGYCRAHNITYQAYSPLSHVDLTDPRIAAVAAAHAKSAAQVALKWVVQQDIILATSPGTNRDFVKQDLELGSFTLTQQEMKTLSDM